jgi:hypothetical protein
MMQESISGRTFEYSMKYLECKEEMQQKKAAEAPGIKEKTHREVLKKGEEQAGEDEPPETLQAHCKGSRQPIMLHVLLLDHVLQCCKHLHASR